MSIVLILGSGPAVTACRDWPRAPFDKIVAINNAWAVRPDWDYLIHPSDFPAERQPIALAASQQIITADTYVPIQNRFGGFVYAGGTMAFTAAYWALGALKPSVIAMLGCDMVYPDADKTHFYGKGTPDPLRKDVTLRDLSAKSARLMHIAAQNGCAMVNLSTDDSTLIFPRHQPNELTSVEAAPYNNAETRAAKAAEERLGYVVPSGKYWKEEDRFDVEEIDALDALWLKAARHP
ncbi:hypothetical protein AB3Y40_14380 [Yoonia sp. R2331]|uniref:hypothetical protein n=1 Tax=Yoonia sp. R2331 TaxID=3237238 RepID=UPI0034E57719